jgi:hypothetical protein
VGEVQRTLNQKFGSKPFRTVDFALRFIIIIESMNLDTKSTVLEGFEPNFLFKVL